MVDVFTDALLSSVKGLMRQACCLLVISLLASCQTTGDPRQGGLLGWSEDKAVQRRTALEQEEADAKRKSEAEIQKGQALRDRKGVVQGEVVQAQRELDALLSENAKLQADLESLMLRQQLSAGELQRLRMVLAANIRLRQQVALNSPSTSASSRPKAGSEVAATRQSAPSVPSDARARLVNDQNATLHREIMALLSR